MLFRDPESWKGLLLSRLPEIFRTARTRINHSPPVRCLALLNREQQIIPIGMDHQREIVVLLRRSEMLSRYGFGTSGLGSGTKPWRFGMEMPGSDWASRTKSSAMMPFRYSNQATTE